MLTALPRDLIRDEEIAQTLLIAVATRSSRGLCMAATLAAARGRVVLHIPFFQISPKVLPQAADGCWQKVKSAARMRPPSHHLRIFATW